MKIEPPYDNNRECPVQDPEKKALLEASAAKWMSENPLLSARLEYWVTVMLISEFDGEDDALYQSRYIKRYLLREISESDLPLMSQLNKAAGLGQRMQQMLDTERERHCKLKITDYEFLKIAKECNYKTHLIVKATELKTRAVQQRKKFLGI